MDLWLNATIYTFFVCFVLLCFVFCYLLARLLYMFRSLLRYCFCFFLYGNVVLSLNISLSRVSQCSIFRCPFFFLLLPRLHMFVCVYVRKMCVCAMVLLAMACFFFISVSVCLWVNSVVFFCFFGVCFWLNLLLLCECF